LTSLLKRVSLWSKLDISKPMFITYAKNKEEAIMQANSLYPEDMLDSRETIKDILEMVKK